ncbi:MAG: hypothetical protein V5B44_20180 [Candidatus Accumulibacter necessarius]|uniref:hypothetical protein n=1 Tax=Candidatus Accumulibacter necessarius TaxID=2954386 RepID=UPI002FC363B2
MCQRSGHLAHGHQALITFQFRFRAVRCGHIVNQQDSPTGRIERTLDDRQAARAKLPLTRRLGRHQPGLVPARPGFTDHRLPNIWQAAGLASLTRARCRAPRRRPARR